MILESPGQEINIKAFPGRTMQRQKVDRMAVVRGEQETGSCFLGVELSKVKRILGIGCITR